jgi:hypothetical protein
MENRLSLLARMADQWIMGKDQRNFAPKFAKKGRAKCGAECVSN